MNCRDGSSLKPLHIWERRNGHGQWVKHTRKKLYCPGCGLEYQVAPCPFRPPRGAKPEPGPKQRGDSRPPYISDEELAERLGRLLLERGKVTSKILHSKNPYVSYATVRRRYGGKGAMEIARQVAREWVEANEQAGAV